jgi:hypothetical protein
MGDEISQLQCHQFCQMDSDCVFHVYDFSSQTCKLYASPDKYCTSLMGIPERVIEECKRNQSKSNSLSNFVQFCLTLSNFVRLCPTLFDFVQLCPTLSYFVQLCQTFSDFVRLCPTLSNYLSNVFQLCPTLSNFVQPCPTLCQSLQILHCADWHSGKGH